MACVAVVKISWTDLVMNSSLRYLQNAWMYSDPFGELKNESTIIYGFHTDDAATKF